MKKKTISSLSGILGYIGLFETAFPLDSVHLSVMQDIAKTIKSLDAGIKAAEPMDISFTQESSREILSVVIREKILMNLEILMNSSEKGLEMSSFSNLIARLKGSALNRI